jgi:hypothetical protein
MFTNLTGDEFIKRFGYVPAPDGGLLHDIDDDNREMMNKAHAERRLWTAVNGDDGGTVIDAGWRFVNRFAYVISERPYTEQEFNGGIGCFLPDPCDECSECGYPFEGEDAVTQSESNPKYCAICYDELFL